MVVEDETVMAGTIVPHTQLPTVQGKLAMVIGLMAEKMVVGQVTEVVMAIGDAIEAPLLIIGAGNKAT